MEKVNFQLWKSKKQKQDVWIRVERVIGLVRQKYTILQCTSPIHFVTKRVGEDIHYNQDSTTCIFLLEWYVSGGILCEKTQWNSQGYHILS